MRKMRSLPCGATKKEATESGTQESCTLSKELHDPTKEDERIAWDSDVIATGDRCEDLYDHHGFYAALA